jgi:transcriptional regulator with XRE-family HTH domain
MEGTAINSMADVDDAEAVETSAKRVGQRIRKIREERGLSQKELGDLVGLSADRVQKYENGYRKAKADLTEKIAEALGVSVLAIEEPTLSEQENSMYAMFELESRYGMSIERVSDGDTYKYFLAADSNTDKKLYDYMNRWFDEYAKYRAALGIASTVSEKEKALHDYHSWQWSFAQTKMKSDKIDKKAQQEAILKKIEELKAAYDRLEE